MAKNHWHKRFHGDALQGYMGLSLEERGAYTTVLDLLYSTDWAEGIPDRPRWIAGHLNCSVRKWESLRASLMEMGKLYLTAEGLLTNSRYVSERKNALEINRARAENGASGGRKSGETRRKAAENRDGDEANASQNDPYARALRVEEELDIEDSPPLPPQGGKPKKRKHGLPDEWEPEEFGLETKSRLIIDRWQPDQRKEQAERFRAHHRKKGSEFVDWQAAWSTWVLNTEKFAKERHNGKSAPTRQHINPLFDAAIAERFGEG